VANQDTNAHEKKKNLSNNKDMLKIKCFREQNWQRFRMNLRPHKPGQKINKEAHVNS